MAIELGEALYAAAARPLRGKRGRCRRGRRLCRRPPRSATFRSRRPASGSKRPGHVVWIGLYEPSAELLRRVQKQFDLHEMAIEDAEQAHQRPKIEQYGEALFIVARTAQLDEGPHRLRRDASLRRARLYRLGPPRRLHLLLGGAPASRSLPDRACERRGLHPLRHPRFHRRQLHAGDRGGARRDRRDRGQGLFRGARRRRRSSGSTCSGAIFCVCGTPPCR